MSYQSLKFFTFLVVVLVLYYSIGRKRQTWILTAANFFFYAMTGEKHLAFILVTMVTTFFTGMIIGNVYEKADEKLALCETAAEKKVIRTEAKNKAKKFLILGMLASIGLLAFCKYTGFLTENLNVILKLLKVPEIEIFRMFLPLGISFYTFMALSYILDIYWKRYKAEKNFIMYAAFLSYFPHAAQGPIDRFNEFKEQIKDGIALNYQNLTYGAQLALWGLFKKLVVADRLGLLVDLIFEAWFSCDGAVLILAVAVYSLQIYADFSGCIDIVTGVSEMLGIKVRKNFNHPYFSKTMPEFWRRWHMSLNEWFKDYIYYPVSASGFMKKGKKYFKEKQNARAMELFATCFPILVVWLITGIWHGADWKYVVWGIYHACLLIGGQIFAPCFEKLTKLFKIDTENFGWKVIQMTRTYILCCIGRVFFRADDMKHAIWIFRKIGMSVSMGSLFSENLSYGMDNANLVVAVFAVLILLVADILQERMKIRETLAKQNIVFRWAIIFAGIFTVLIFGMYGPGYDASSFIYEQF